MLLRDVKNVKVILFFLFLTNQKKILKEKNKSSGIRRNSISLEVFLKFCDV